MLQTGMTYLLFFLSRAISSTFFVTIHKLYVRKQPKFNIWHENENGFGRYFFWGGVLSYLKQSHYIAFENLESSLQVAWTAIINPAERYAIVFHGRDELFQNVSFRWTVSLKMFKRSTFGERSGALTLCTLCCFQREVFRWYSVHCLSISICISFNICACGVCWFDVDLWNKSHL